MEVSRFSRLDKRIEAIKTRRKQDECYEKV